jgi:hypothetical protein
MKRWGVTGQSRRRELALNSTVNLRERRNTVAHKSSLPVAPLMGGRTRLSWLPAGDADWERCPHTQHTAPCRPGIPPPRRSRRSCAGVYRHGADSWETAVGLVPIVRGSRCTSGTPRRDCSQWCYFNALISAMQDRLAPLSRVDRLKWAVLGHVWLAFLCHAAFNSRAEARGTEVKSSRVGRVEDV